MRTGESLRSRFTIPMVARSPPRTRGLQISPHLQCEWQPRPPVLPLMPWRRRFQVYQAGCPEPAGGSNQATVSGDFLIRLCE